MDIDTAKSVCIVDDDEIFADELREALSMSGYDPVVITNAEAAANKINQLRPDVVLLDLNMPRKNGFEIARDLRYNARVIAMTGQYKPSFDAQLKESGIFRCIRKPFFPLDVISVIEDI